MTAVFTIRRATEEDTGTLHTLLSGLAAHVGEAGLFAGTEKDLRTYGFGPGAVFEALIAEDGAIPLGMVLFFPEFSTWRGRPGVYVQDLYVAETARGTGLGRRLVAAAAQRGTAWGAVYMRLSVHAGNAEAAGFYAQLGFSISEKEEINIAEGDAFVALSDESLTR